MELFVTLPKAERHRQWTRGSIRPALVAAFETPPLRLIRCERPFYAEVPAQKMRAPTPFKEGWPLAKSFPQGLPDDLLEERLPQGLQSAMALLYGKSAQHTDADA